MNILIFSVIIGLASCGILSSWREKLDRKLLVYADAFEQYLKLHNKHYKGNNEMIYRLGLFAQTLIALKTNSAKMPSATLGVNKFADWSREERKKILNKRLTPMAPQQENVGSASSRSSSTTNVKSTASKSTAVAVDWRRKGVVGPVRDQQNCGSCWAFSTMSTVESNRGIRGFPTPQLSPQSLVDCDSKNSGCEGGVPKIALQHIQQHGAVSEKDYPYKNKNGRCSVKDTKVKIDGVATFKGEAEMEKFVKNNGTMVICVWVVESMFSYKNGVFYPPTCNKNNSEGGHAMAVVGYGTEKGIDYWLVKNSWDTSFGEQGYIKIAKGRDICGIETFCPTAPIVR